MHKKMATREIRNKLDEQRQYRKDRGRHDRDAREHCSSVRKKRRMNPDFVEKWDAAALKVM